MATPSKSPFDKKKDLRPLLSRKSGHSESEAESEEIEVVTSPDSEIEVVAGPSRKRVKSTPKLVDLPGEDDPNRVTRAHLATPCKRRPPSCSPERGLQGVPWVSPATTNTCVWIDS